MTSALSVPPHDLTVGQRIRWARRRKGISQEKLANAIGTTRQVVIRWEKNAHLPNYKSRQRLAEALDLDSSFFRENSDEEDEEDDPMRRAFLDFYAALKPHFRAREEEAVEL